MRKSERDRETGRDRKKISATIAWFGKRFHFQKSWLFVELSRFYFKSHTLLEHEKIKQNMEFVRHTFILCIYEYNTHTQKLYTLWDKSYDCDIKYRYVHSLMSQLDIFKNVLSIECKSLFIFVIFSIPFNSFYDEQNRLHWIKLLFHLWCAIILD